MKPDDLELKLTAFALDDPSLSAIERTEIAALLLRDPAAKATVDETRALAGTLTTALAGELSTVKPGAITPSTLVRPVVPEPKLFFRFAVLAASVVFVVAAGTFAIKSMGENASGTYNFVSQKVSTAHGAAKVAYERPSGGLDENNRYRVESVSADQPSEAKNQLALSQGQAKRGPSVASATTPTPAPGFAGGIGGGGIGGFNGGGMPGGGGPAGPGGGVVASLPAPSGPRGGIPAPSFDGGRGAAPGSGDGGRLQVEVKPMGGALAHPGSPAPDAIAMGGEPGKTMRGKGPAKPAAPMDSAKVAEGEGIKGDDSYRRDRLEENLRKLQSEQKVPDRIGNDRFGGLIENDFVEVKGQNAKSTFGVDVDTASYSIIRKMLTDGTVPPPSAIRLEELVNYFPYKDKAPEGDDPYRVTVELAECPWQPQHTLARIALKAKPIERDKRPPSNLVFLVDVSGSMDEPNKLPWVKQSLTMLVDQLGENDRISIVVYAGASGVVLDSTSAINKNMILQSLDRLNAGGSTNGGAGIELAYAIAEKNFIKNGTNRVVLCTDGDWNVGTTSTEALVSLIEKKRQSNVFLSVLGFGMGNLRDEMMVKLANKGNGNYAYIDTLAEARKVLVEQIAGTLVTVAKDVKLQIEFNPGRIKSYRLLGYEKRALANRDFADDRKDAGEMGAGHVVTAFYELVPTTAVEVVGGEKLEFQPDPKPVAPVNDNPNAMLLKLRHKPPTSDTSIERKMMVKDRRVPVSEASEDFRFGAAVATFAMTLRDSAHKGHGSLAMAVELAQSAKEYDPNGYRAEFMLLIRRAMQVTGKP